MFTFLLCAFFCGVLAVALWRYCSTHLYGFCCCRSTGWDCGPRALALVWAVVCFRPVAECTPSGLDAQH